MSEVVTTKINAADTVPKRVNFCWPPVDTRIPEAVRPKPQIEGFADCEFQYFNQGQLEEQDALVASGELDSLDRFALLVPVIKGLPLADGQTAHGWLKESKYGSVIRAAIQQDYFEFIGEGRRGNSGKRR